MGRKRGRLGVVGGLDGKTVALGRLCVGEGWGERKWGDGVNEKTKLIRGETYK